MEPAATGPGPAVHRSSHVSLLFIDDLHGCRVWDEQRVSVDLGHGTTRTLAEGAPAHISWRLVVRVMRHESLLHGSWLDHPWGKRVATFRCDLERISLARRSDHYPNAQGILLRRFLPCRQRMHCGRNRRHKPP